jgi:hypothetical protein
MNKEDEKVKEALNSVYQNIDKLIWEQVKSIFHSSPEEEKITYNLCVENFWKKYEIYSETDYENKKISIKIRKKVFTRNDIKNVIGEDKLEKIEEMILGEKNNE